MTEQIHDQAQLERLTFFSDAVFAIAMTLLIVEVKLPPIPVTSEQALAQALVELIPQYVGFFVSFVVVGRFWIGHHRVFGRLKRCNDRLVSLNLWFLLTIAFMPFPTTLVSHYVDTRVGVGFYAAWLTVAGVANIMLQRYAVRSGLAAPGGADDLRRWSRAAWSPVIIGVLAVAVAMVTPLLVMVPLGLSPIVAGRFNRQPRTLPKP